MRNLGLMSRAVRPSNSSSGYTKTASCHTLPSGTCPQVHLILKFIIPPAPKAGQGLRFFCSGVEEGSHDLRMSMERRRGRVREEQGPTWPSTAKHLARMSPRRGVSIQQPHVSWGNQSFKVDLLKSFMFPQK